MTVCKEIEKEIKKYIDNIPDNIRDDNNLKMITRIQVFEYLKWVRFGMSSWGQISFKHVIFNTEPKERIKAFSEWCSVSKFGGFKTDYFDGVILREIYEVTESISSNYKYFYEFEKNSIKQQILDNTYIEVKKNVINSIENIKKSLIAKYENVGLFNKFDFDYCTNDTLEYLNDIKYKTTSLLVSTERATQRAKNLFNEVFYADFIVRSNGNLMLNIYGAILYYGSLMYFTNLISLNIKEYITRSKIKYEKFINEDILIDDTMLNSMELKIKEFDTILFKTSNYLKKNQLHYSFAYFFKVFFHESKYNDVKYLLNALNIVKTENFDKLDIVKNIEELHPFEKNPRTTFYK